MHHEGAKTPRGTGLGWNRLLSTIVQSQPGIVTNNKTFATSWPSFASALARSVRLAIVITFICALASAAQNVPLTPSPGACRPTDTGDTLQRTARSSRTNFLVGDVRPVMNITAPPACTSPSRTSHPEPTGSGRILLQRRSRQQ